MDVVDGGVKGGGVDGLCGVNVILSCFKMAERSIWTLEKFWLEN